MSAARCSRLTGEGVIEMSMIRAAAMKSCRSEGRGIQQAQLQRRKTGTTFPMTSCRLELLATRKRGASVAGGGRGTERRPTLIVYFVACTGFRIVHPTRVIALFVLSGIPARVDIHPRTGKLRRGMAGVSPAIIYTSRALCRLLLKATVTQIMKHRAERQRAGAGHE